MFFTRRRNYIDYLYHEGEPHAKRIPIPVKTLGLPKVVIVRRDHAK